MTLPNLQAHCQSPTSQLYNQSFVKELAKLPLLKTMFKKLPTLIKIKNTVPRAVINRQESKMIITSKLNNDNGLQD